MKDQAQNSGRCDPTSAASGTISCWENHESRRRRRICVICVFQDRKYCKSLQFALLFLPFFPATLDYSTVVKGKTSYFIFMIMLYLTFKAN